MAESKKPASKPKQSQKKTAKQQTPAAPTQANTGAPSVSTKQRRGINVWSMFWGGLLVLVGTLALLANFNIVEVDFGQLWRLWPLVIIAGGIAVLPLKGVIKSLVSVAFVLVSLSMAFYIVTSAPRSGVVTSDRQIVQLDTAQSVEAARVSVRAGAGEVRINDDAADDEVVTATLRSNFATLERESSVDGATQIVDLSLSGSRSWWLGAWENRLTVGLSRTIPTEVVLDTGAASVVADLRAVALRQLDVQAGASSMEFTLGAVERRLDVNISAGASSIVVRVPRNSGVSVKVTGALNSADFADLSERDGAYVSEGFDDADSHIVIDANISAASFRLERY